MRSPIVFELVAVGVNDGRSSCRPNSPISPPERYVVEIDGITKSEYSVFVKALTASLQLRHEFPHSSVKLRDADEKAPLHAH